MHHVSCFWVNLVTAYIGQCISVTNITHLDSLCVTIRVLLCVLKGLLLSLGIFFLWVSFKGCYENMYIIAVLFFKILLFCLKGYSETLTDCTSSATSNTTVVIHVFAHLDKSKTWNIAFDAKLKESFSGDISDKFFCAEYWILCLSDVSFCVTSMHSP